MGEGGRVLCVHVWWLNLARRASQQEREGERVRAPMFEVMSTYVANTTECQPGERAYLIMSTDTHLLGCITSTLALT